MNKFISFTVSVATQLWQIFVLMTIWNWFASEWHVFTFMQLFWLQVFIKLLSVTAEGVSSRYSVKKTEMQAGDEAIADIALFILLSLVYLAAFIVKCFH
jgi:hypothetical protein